MAIMAHECWIAVTSIKIEMVRHFLILPSIDHSPSTIDSIGHGVTSFRKYSLKYRVMPRTTRIMQIRVHSISNRGLQQRTLTQTRRIGLPQ